jgi:hypothetical protein
MFSLSRSCYYERPPPEEKAHTEVSRAHRRHRANRSGVPRLRIPAGQRRAS